MVFVDFWTNKVLVPWSMMLLELQMRSWKGCGKTKWKGWCFVWAVVDGACGCSEWGGPQTHLVHRNHVEAQACQAAQRLSARQRRRRRCPHACYVSLCVTSKRRWVSASTPVGVHTNTRCPAAAATLNTVAQPSCRMRLGPALWRHLPELRGNRKADFVAKNQALLVAAIHPKDEQWLTNTINTIAQCQHRMARIGQVLGHDAQEKTIQSTDSKSSAWAVSRVSFSIGSGIIRQLTVFMCAMRSLANVLTMAIASGGLGFFQSLP